MYLDEITFQHFFLEVKQAVSKDLLEIVNPNIMKFFKYGNIYLALSNPSDKLVVNFAINTGKKNEGDWVEEMRKFAIRQKFKGIIFHTSESNKIVQNIANSRGCKLVDTIDDYYANGEKMLVFEYQIQ